jgi:putative ABC transport system permease protein
LSVSALTFCKVVRIPPRTWLHRLSTCHRQDPIQGFTILVRSHTARAPLVEELRHALRELDPDIPIFNIVTMDEAIAQRSWPWRVFGGLFLTFAVIALVMSSVGIYAITAYGVHQRTQEIGVRIALGANQKNVLWLVLRQGLLRIAVGLAIGLLAAWGMSRVLVSLLFQVTPTDPVTFISISLLLVLTTIIACVVPAWRAKGLDPAIALRQE